MINLLLIVLLSLASFLPFSSFVDLPGRAEDAANVNNVVELNDSPSSKGAYSFEHGETYMTHSDLLASDVYLEFLQNMPSTWTTIQPYYYANNGEGGIVSISGIDGYFFKITNSQVEQSLARVTYIGISRTNVYKFTTTFQGEQVTIIESQYYFRFYDAPNGTWYYTTHIWVEYPLWNHDYGSLGMQISHSQEAHSNVFTDNYYCYFENPTTGTGVFWPYVYAVRRDNSGDAYTNGYNVGKQEGFQNGYSKGLTASNTSAVANSIMNGIFDVGLLPVNVFLTIFNFEVFGVNIAGIVSGLLTLAVVVIVIRFLLGGKKDDQ